MTEQRNTKISHLIESAIKDFCKLLKCSYYTKEEGIMVQFEKEDLFFVFPEFENDNFTININCFMYSDLALSKATKLKAVYKVDEVAEYIDEAGTLLWFLEDTNLIMSYVSSSQYSGFALLNSKVLLDMYINV